MKFEQELIKRGITESKVVDLAEGLDKVHRALCKLDLTNLSLVVDNGGSGGSFKEVC